MKGGHEWIDSRSSRIALYRTHTIPLDYQTNYMSPFPESINTPNAMTSCYQSLKEIAYDSAHTLNQISNLLFKLVKNEEHKSLVSHRPVVTAEPVVPQSKHINCTTKDDETNCVISEHISQVDNDELSVHSLKSQQKQVMYEQQDTFSVTSQSVKQSTVQMEGVRYSQNELQNYLLASQLAPLLDRQGRFMMDVSRHFALYGANIQ